MPIKKISGRDVGWPSQGLNLQLTHLPQGFRDSRSTCNNSHKQLCNARTKQGIVDAVEPHKIRTHFRTNWNICRKAAWATYTHGCLHPSECRWPECMVVGLVRTSPSCDCTVGLLQDPDGWQDHAGSRAQEASDCQQHIHWKAISKLPNQEVTKEKEFKDGKSQ